MGIIAAMEDIKNGNFGDIPAALKDSSYKGAKELSHGAGYHYAHNYENSYIKQQYLPDEIKDRQYYVYGGNKTEQAAKAYWDLIKGQNK